jgi:hypothetical protein
VTDFVRIGAGTHRDLERLDLPWRSAAAIFDAMMVHHGERHTRRQLFLQSLAGGLVCSLVEPWRTLLSAEQVRATIKAGRIYGSALMAVEG